MIDAERFSELVREYAVKHDMRGSIQVMVAALDEMNMPNPEIVKYLGVSPQSVSKARLKYRQHMALRQTM